MSHSQIIEAHSLRFPSMKPQGKGKSVFIPSFIHHIVGWEGGIRNYGSRNSSDTISSLYSAKLQVSLRKYNCEWGRY